MTNKMIRYILLLISIYTNVTTAQTTTEPIDTPDICKPCECHEAINEKGALLVLDCAGRKFEHLLPDWPNSELMNPDTISSHDADYSKDVIITYSNNSIKILQQLPHTQAHFQFSCRHCDLIDINSDAFHNTSNIVRLDLSHNNLTGHNYDGSMYHKNVIPISTHNMLADLKAPDSITYKSGQTPIYFLGDVLQPTIFRAAENSELINLVELDLSYNQIRSLDSRLFQHARMIKKLSLQYNPFNALDDNTTEAISSLNHLEDLNLAGTGLSELSRKLLEPLHNLKVLIIHGNNFIEAPETLAHSSKSLKSLSIDDNPIVCLNFNSFLDLSELTHLNMSNLKNLTDIRPESFSPLISIEVINAFGNDRLTRFDFNSLATMPQLRELDVSSCGLSNLEISFTNASAGNNHSNILLFPNLKKLKLENNPWLCNCDLLQQLRRMNYFNISQNHDKKTEARCSEPYEVAGMLLMDFLDLPDCNVTEITLPRTPVYDLPQFLRERYIIITIVAVVITLLLGLLIGFIVVKVRRVRRVRDVACRSVQYTVVRYNNVSPARNNSSAYE